MRQKSDALFSTVVAKFCSFFVLTHVLDQDFLRFAQVFVNDTIVGMVES